MKLQNLKREIYICTMLTGLFLIFTFMVPASEAHVLIIADGQSDIPSDVITANNTARALDDQGYEVLELYQENATTKNIVKGMYNADAVIYAGHGGYETGHYDGNGGAASPPFALVGSDDFVWGINDKIREGWDGTVITAPFKSHIPVILYLACFSTGRVEDKEVSNPIETIYNFSLMFTGAGANYYATCYEGSYQGKTVVDIVDEFLNGATSFSDANTKNSGQTITESTTYNGVPIWRNEHGWNAFVGDWSATFPAASQTTPYDDKAAEAWYQTLIDKTPPKVSSISPANGATNVAASKTITVTFNEAIKAGSNFWIELKNSSGTIIPITTSFAGNVLSITHLNILQESKYTLALHTGCVTDLAGNPLALCGINFIVGTSPTITSSDPINNAVNVLSNKVIKVAFNEAIKAGSNFWVELKNSGGTAIPFAKSISGNVLTVVPTNNLAESLYTLIIHTGAVTDLAGNPAVSKSIKFSVGTSPTAASTDPLNGATKVARNKTITVTFNENIKAGSNYWIEFVSGNGTAVAITKAISGKVLNITHSTILAANTKYTLIMHTGSLTDLAGNPLAVKSFIFTTGST